MRLGLTDKSRDFLLQHVPRISGNLNLVLKDEALGSSAGSTDGGGSTAGSLGSLPKEWQTTEVVYAIDVPPWYLQDDVEAMVAWGVENKGLTEFKVERVGWSVGAVRTATWDVVGLASGSLSTQSSKAPMGISPRSPLMSTAG